MNNIKTNYYATKAQQKEFYILHCMYIEMFEKYKCNINLAYAKLDSWNSGSLLKQRLNKYYTRNS